MALICGCVFSVSQAFQPMVSARFFLKPLSLTVEKVLLD